MATLKDSQRQERRLSTLVGGSVNSGSGNGWIRKADVRSEKELWELKITSAKSYSLKDAELSKHNDQAIVDGRIPVFMIEFDGSGNEWIILSKDDYLELRNKVWDGSENNR